MHPINLTLLSKIGAPCLGVSCYIMVRLKIEISQASFKFKDTVGSAATVAQNILSSFHCRPRNCPFLPDIILPLHPSRCAAAAGVVAQGFCRRRSVESFLCLAFLDSAGRYFAMMIAAVAAAAFTISGDAFVMGKLPFKFHL